MSKSWGQCRFDRMGGVDRPAGSCKRVVGYGIKGGARPGPLACLFCGGGRTQRWEAGRWEWTLGCPPMASVTVNRIHGRLTTHPPPSTLPHTTPTDSRAAAPPPSPTTAPPPGRRRQRRASDRRSSGHARCSASDSSPPPSSSRPSRAPPPGPSAAGCSCGEGTTGTRYGWVYRGAAHMRACPIHRSLIDG